MYNIISEVAGKLSFLFLLGIENSSHIYYNNTELGIVHVTMRHIYMFFIIFNKVVMMLF